MRILVDNSGYKLLNQGDVSMLQVAVTKLRNLWPDALIQVITHAPDLLTAYCPDVHPLTLHGRYRWCNVRKLFGRFYRLVPGPVSRLLFKLEKEIWCRWSALAQRWVQFRRKRRVQVTDDDIEEMSAFSEAILGADLVVASGGGYITDVFRWHAAAILDTLEIATRIGTPTAMLSQGLGPVQHPALRARARAVLPSVDLIALRENRAGFPLLDSLGVIPSRVITTGDDAVELAYEARATELGTGIGVNLRVTRYSEVDSSLVEIVRSVLHRAAKKYGAPIIPLPISFHDDESDVRVIRHLLAGYDSTSDGGQSLDSPLKVVEQVGRCRVVVTGSYHAAIFALAQGIPIVGLAKSAYYIDKFLGLADQFSNGCKVVLLDDEQLWEKLTSGIDSAWGLAGQIRSQLLEVAVRQIELGHAAYRRVYELVASPV